MAEINKSVNVVQGGQGADINNKHGAPLVFLRERDIFGSRKPDKNEWLTHVELYKSISKIIDCSHITGLQRVGGMWRIYIDNLDDKVQLMAEGVQIRGNKIQLLNTNPERLDGEGTIKIRVKNIPLSADDGIIKRKFTLMGLDVIQSIREKLRVDNKLTNCETGDRLITVKAITLKEPLPRAIQFGQFIGRVFHIGQHNNQRSNSDTTCSKCLMTGHRFQECTNDWVCKQCKQSGHKQTDCPTVESSDSEIENDSQISSDENTPVAEHTRTPRTQSRTKRMNLRRASPSVSSSARQKSIEHFITSTAKQNTVKPCSNNDPVCDNTSSPMKNGRTQTNTTVKEKKQKLKK